MSTSRSESEERRQRLIREGIALCFTLRAKTYVRDVTRMKSPLSTVTVCDNDGATYGVFDVAPDGRFTVDFTLRGHDDVRHAPARITDRIKFHFHARGDIAGNGDDSFEFNVATGHEYLRDVLEAVAEAHGVSVRRSAKSRKERGAFVCGHNFAPCSVRVEACGTKTVDKSLALDPVPQPNLTPTQMLSRFDEMVKAGAITPSALWQSEPMNKLVEKQASLMERGLMSKLRIDESRGLGNFSVMGSFFPMFKEMIVYTDVYDAMIHMPQEYSPVVVVGCGCTIGFNVHDVSLADAVHVSDHGMCYLLASSATFFTVDNIAGAYVMDASFMGVADGSTGASAWKTDFTVGPDENISRALSKPNVGGRTFSANDCEDHTATIIANLKGIIESDELAQRDPAAFRRELEHPLLGRLSVEEKKGLEVAIRRFAGLLAPFRERLGYSPRKERRPAEYRVDATNVLGTALGASADGVTGDFGGHSYAHLSLTPTNSRGKPENIVLEGTALVQGLDTGGRVKCVPFLQKVPPEKIPLATAQGFRLLGESPDKTGMMMERDLVVDDFLMALEANEFMEVDQRLCRRTIPWVTLSARTTRSHAHDFGGVYRDLEQKARTSFYQDAVVMGSSIVTEVTSPGVESLGTFFPSYTPGKPGVVLTSVSGSGLTEDEFKQMNKYKKDRLSEIFEPLVTPNLVADIAKTWKPVECVAKPRGAGINDYMASVYCVTVSESSMDPAVRERQYMKAREKADAANAFMRAKGVPHRMLCHEAIHSSLRTLVVHKDFVGEQVVGSES